MQLDDVLLDAAAGEHAARHCSGHLTIMKFTMKWRASAPHGLKGERGRDGTRASHLFTIQHIQRMIPRMSDTSTANGRDQQTGQFLSGCKGGPGRQVGSRNRLAESFIADLRDTWEVHGRDALERVARDQPEVLLKVVASLMPRDIDLNVSATADAVSFAQNFRSALQIDSRGADAHDRARGHAMTVTQQEVDELRHEGELLDLDAADNSLQSLAEVIGYVVYQWRQFGADQDELEHDLELLLRALAINQYELRQARDTLKTLRYSPGVIKLLTRLATKAGPKQVRKPPGRGRTTVQAGY